MDKICPTHGTPFQEFQHGPVVIDSCPYGCVHLDPGELDHLLNAFGGAHGLPQQQYVPPVPQGRHIQDSGGFFAGVFGGHGGHGHSRSSSDHGYGYGHGGGHRRHRSHRSWGSGFEIFGSD